MSKEGTLIKTRYPFLYFDNVDINSIEEARNLSDTLDKHLDRIKADIQSLAIATPKDITPKGEVPLNYINEKIDEIFDELYEVARDYYTVDIIKNILEEWSWRCYSEDKELYPNAEEDKELNERAFIEDEHIEVERDMTKFTFAPPDDNISQTITRAIQNVKLNDSLSNEIIDKYIILLGNKPYVDYDGQFLFSSKEKAENVLKKKMDFHSIDYISRDFIELHPDYFTTVIDKLKDNKEQFKETLDNLKLGNILSNLDKFEFINKLFSEAVISEVFEILRVKIITFESLINSYFIDTLDYSDTTKKMIKKTLK